MPQPKTETIRKLREDNLRMSALLKRASGEPLTAEEKEYIEELAKARALTERLEQQYDLDGAIRKALRSPKGLTNANPDTTELLKNALFSDSAKKALGSEEDEALAKRREKVRADIKSSGIPRRQL
jgi:hypothetical protein